MAEATLTEKGQVVIPAAIRARYGLTPGTKVEFVDDAGTIRLLIRRPVTPTDVAAGYGMIKIAPSPPGRPPRRLANFDAASTLKRPQGKT